MLLGFALKKLDAGEIKISQPDAEEGPTAVDSNTRLGISPRTAERISQMERELDIADDSKIAEVLLGQVIKDIKEGEFGLLDGWEWRSVRKAKKTMQRLSAKWQAEDAVLGEEVNK